jgi:hypothetical protein
MPQFITFMNLEFHLLPMDILSTILNTKGLLCRVPN